MENSYSKKNIYFSNLLRLADSFYMRFLVVIFTLIIAAGFVGQRILSMGKFSKASLFIFIAAAILVTIVWIRLDLKVTPTIFSGYITKDVKKKALIRRGIILLFMFKLLDEFNKGNSSLGFLLNSFNHLSRAYLKTGLVVIIIAMLIILVRPTRRR